MIKLSKQKLSILIFSILILTSSFTDVRIWRIGICDLCAIMLFFLSITNMKSNLKKNNYFITFIYFEIVWLMLGIIMNYVINPFFNIQTLGDISGLTFDYIAYIFVLFSIIGVSYLLDMKTIDMYEVFERLYVCYFFMYLFLYIISLRFSHIGPFNILSYGGNFSALSSNIHHTSMVLGPMAFIGFYIMDKKSRKKDKVKFALMAIFLLFLTTNTGSDKAIFGVLAGLIVITIHIIIKGMQLQSYKKHIYIVLFFILIIFCILYSQKIQVILITTFTNSDGGGARTTLYSQTFESFVSSPIFGRGPGPMIWFNNKWFDTHSTILTILLQGGIILFISFCVLLYKVLLDIRSNPFLFCSFICISIYILGGDILRRMPVWIMLMVLSYFGKQERRNK